MDLFARLEADHMEARKKQDKMATRVLSTLISDIKYAAMETPSKSPDDKLCYKVLAKTIQQKTDSMEFAERGQRSDYLEEEGAALEVLLQYQPSKLSETELDVLISYHIRSAQAKGPKDLKLVMGPLMEAIGTRADGHMVREQLMQRLAAEDAANQTL